MEEVVEAEVVNDHLFDDELHETYVFNGVRHIFPKREYVDINTHKWTTKYNDLLKRCRDAEGKINYLRNKFDTTNTS